MNKVMPKPADSKWTDEQWQAICRRGEDILVAAAAGSGKTAVLVERIITMIREKIADVDRLLIVTFTNAAASEMRKRIGEAIDKELSLHPSSLYLRRQLSLINKASISTLHSFCIEVLRKYYYLIDLDPGFRIADETEIVLLAQEVIEEFFEEEYSKGEDHYFYQVVDAYSSDRDDRKLQDLILKLYEFSRSHPEPEVWLEQMAAEYDVQTDNIDELPWTKELLDDCIMQLKGLLTVIEQAKELATTPGGPESYALTLEEDALLINGLIEKGQNSWNELYDAFQNIAFAKLKAIRGGDVDALLKEKVKNMRDMVKKKVEGLKKERFERNPESFCMHLQEMAPIVKHLVFLVKEFAKRFKKEKEERGLVDFGDLEHYCLQILKHPDAAPGELIPSDAAAEYRNRFVEVLVDEYQDTNLVQESIVKLVSNGNNLFMVGDVKQSIYRFRLAEPGLFLAKYKRFTKEGDGTGLRIDLAKNFRSRTEVLDATNFIFKQIMSETVGEIAYDEDAALIHGATYYPENDGLETELLVINKSTPVVDEEGLETGESEKSELETVQLEARVIAEKIKQLVGTEGKPPAAVLDKTTGSLRPVKYKDIVILLRATSTWAPAMLEEFKQQGIPAYAELSTGYFEAVEVKVMMSLLKVIDNPLQDIPLAAVLRSPIVGLSGEEMASVRLINQKRGTYFDSLKSYLEKGPSNQLKERLERFYHLLEKWREAARGGSLAQLIWQIYRETGYFDFVSGMPGGRQRQANLRALYDRARQYESTSFRGLFRFLRFIERMQDRGKDLGAARALGEQEDVVRIMTIHKSKGLEFPIVFVAGMNKQFNQMDLKQSVLLHKELGLGTEYINPEYRVKYETIPQIAIKKRMKMELLAEEMRILYVALTRAKEKLYLLGTVNDAEKSIEQWGSALSVEDWLLPDYERAQAKSYLDWVARCVIRHKDGSELRAFLSSPENGRGEPFVDQAKWKIEVLDASNYEQLDELNQSKQQEILAALKRYEPVDISSDQKEMIDERLDWKYPHLPATATMSKQSVTEIKRQYEIIDEYSDHTLVKPFRSSIASRPRFMQAKEMTSTERGTAMHMVMQHVNVKEEITLERLNEQVAKMVHNELLTDEQADGIDVGSVLQFFQSELGKRVLKAKNVRRELPFSMALSLSEVGKTTGGLEDETVLVQGVIDCLLVEEDGLVLIDYKTDQITNRFEQGFNGAKTILLNRYQLQLELYGKAIEKILKQPLKESYLYFFDGSHILQVK
ncbi:helicase-exonuclease AddAB subunit AddA [Fictibacillus sp. Mic-4]|uniref:helicase-exonuclease AddAB subunit AddA n=1 Tax=Fictibacillus sp. Mic-4 TaxID=3132826 RepID=UPI003CE9E012